MKKTDFSLTREKNKRNLLDLFMHTWSNLRSKTEKFFPLTENEKILYTDVFAPKSISLPADKKHIYIKDELFLLTSSRKTEARRLVSGIKRILNSKEIENRDLYVTNDSIEMLFDSAGVSNSNSFLGEYSFNVEKRFYKKKIKSIDIMFFDLSANYFGISVRICPSDAVMKRLEALVAGDFRDKGFFDKVYTGKKRKLVRRPSNLDNLRMDKIDYILADLKKSCYVFLKKYLPFTGYSGQFPIGMDVYNTNYDFKKDKSDAFTSSFGFYDFEKLSGGSLNTIYSDGSGFKKLDFRFYSHDFTSLVNRSGKILFNVKDDGKKTEIYQSEMINFFKVILYFYTLREFEVSLLNGKLWLESVEENNSLRAFKIYGRGMNRFSFYRNFFSEIKLYKRNTYYNSILFDESFENQVKRFRKLEIQSKVISDDYYDKMLVKNYLKVFKLSRLTIFIALLSLFITILFSFSNQKTTEKFID